MDRFFLAQDWLSELASEAQFFRKARQPSLNTVNKILDHLKRPDESFQYRIIIGGTAGKGTTARRTEAILLAAGKSVGLIASPHVQSITERIRINGRLIHVDDFGRTILEIKNSAEKLSLSLTYYEAIVLAGILAAAAAGCQYLIGEIGLGGEFDAVNVVRGKRVAAVTFIGNDHLELFDNSFERLARAKAGIFTHESELNLSYEKKFRGIFQEISPNPIKFLGGLRAGMNKKIARNICEYILGNPNFISPQISIPGRWESVFTENGQKVLFDGAHSEPRFEYLKPRLKKIRGKIVGVCALAQNHSRESFRSVVDLFDEIIWTTVPGARPMHEPPKLQKFYNRGFVISDPIAAFKKAAAINDATILVTGSFFLVGAVRELFYASEDIMKKQTEFPRKSSRPSL